MIQLNLFKKPTQILPYSGESGPSQLTMASGGTDGEGVGQSKFVINFAWLTGIWLLFWGALALGRVAGWQVGLQIWPFTEDYNWLYMLEHANGIEMPKVFWKLDHRNPLAAWWYLAAKPIITSAPSAWFLFRRFEDLVLAFTVTTLLGRFDPSRRSSFPLYCGMGVLLSACFYSPLLVWSMTAAVILSMWSIYAYTRYVEEAHGKWLGVSLVLYFLAIGTYTIQAPAMLAIPMIGYFYQSKRPESQSRRVVRTVSDTLLFAAVFAAFYMLWLTTAPSGGFSHEALSPSIFSRQLGKSIAAHLYSSIYNFAILPYCSRMQLLLVMGAVGITLFTIIFLHDRSFGTRSEPLSAGALGYSVGVGVSLATGSILLESMSDIFVPGTRAVMVQQVIVPVFYMAGLFAVVKVMSAFSTTLARAFQIVSVSALLCYFALMSITVNHRDTATTRSHIEFCETIHRTIGPLSEPTHLIVFMEDRPVYPVYEPHVLKKKHGVTNRLMIQQVMKGSRLIDQHPNADKNLDIQLTLPGRIMLGQHGVKLTRWFTEPAQWVSYDRVLFAKWNRGQLEFLKEFPAEYLDNYMIGMDKGLTPKSVPTNAGIDRLLTIGAFSANSRMRLLAEVGPTR